MFVPKYILPYLVVLWGLLSLGCWNSLKIQEVLEGDDGWIRELTRNMQISSAYRAEISTHQAWEFTLTIENQGEYEPHLNTISIEKLSLQHTPWQCQIREPDVRQGQQGPNWYLFFLEERRVRRNETVTVRLACVFEQPGVYELLIGATFKESGINFFSKKITLEVR